MLIKLLVDDKDYDTNDGYDLYSYDSYEIAEAIKLALDNGFKDIRISEASQEEKLEYNQRRKKQHELKFEY